MIKNLLRSFLKLFLIHAVLIACVFNTSFAAQTNHAPKKSKQQHVAKKAKQHITQHKKKKARPLASQSRRKTKPKTIVKKSLPNRAPPKAQIAEEEDGIVASLEHRLVEFVRKTVTTLRYSAYKLGGSKFDTSRGIYILDCSNYVDHILKTIHPRAYSKLVASSKSDIPTSDDYYHFFTKLPDRPSYYWNPVEDVSSLLPGDILVFRKKNKYGEIGGHVMIVMEKPVREKDVFWLRIADSAPFRHSLDTRMARVSGIGIGTFLVKVNPKTFQPAAYAWTASSRWKQNVIFAMARPVDIPS